MLDTPSLLAKSPEYAALEPARTLVRDLMGGTRAVRAKGTCYLPKWEGEEEGIAGVKGYQRRLGTAVLEPFFDDAVRDLAGRVFSKDVIVGADVPVAIRGDEVEGVEGLWERIDNAKYNGHEFLRRVFFSGISEGECAVLVEHTPPAPTTNPRGPTPKEIKEARARPYWVRVDSINILDVVETTENGRPVLTYVRIREADRIEGEGKERKAIPRVRKLFRGDRRRVGPGGEKLPGYHTRFEVWEIRKGEGVQETEVKAEFGEMRPQTEIPFVRFRPEEDGAPPLEDLAHANIRYFRQESQLDHNLFMSAVNGLWGVGIKEDEQIKIMSTGLGAGFMWFASDPEAEFGPLEFDGKVAAALQARLDKLEQRMRRQAREPLLALSGDRTAREAAVEEARAHSLLESWVLALKDRSEEALAFTALYLGETSGGSLSINRRFGFAGNSGELLDRIIKMRERGDISRQTLWEVAEMLRALPDTFDFEAEEQRLADEGPAAGDDEEIRGKVAALEARLAEREGSTAGGEEAEGGARREAA
jgi:hypothetical protein